MHESSAYQKIQAAIQAAGDPNAEGHSDALQLLSTSLSNYTNVLDALQDGLVSHSSAVRELCAMNIGRFGRATDWAVPALLKALKDSPPDSIEANVVAFSLANLKTKQSADGLATFVQLNKEQLLNNDTRVIDALAALSSMGPIAAPYLPLYTDVLSHLQNAPHYSEQYVRAAQRSLSESILSAYERFSCSPDARQDRLFQIDLAKDQISYTSGQLLGRCEVKFDERVWYNSPSVEVRCIIVQLPTKEAACIGVLDTYTGEHINSEFAVFQQQVQKALLETPADTWPKAFFLFTSPERSRDGHHQLQQVTLEDNGNGSLLRRLLPAKQSHKFFGDNLRAIEEYLLEPSPFPLGFMQYYEGSLNDELAMQRFAQQQAIAGNDTLDYTLMVSDFSHEIRITIEAKEEGVRHSRKGKKPHTKTYHDSLQGVSNQELPLPQQLKEFFDSAAAYQQRQADLKEHFQELSRDPLSSPEEILAEISASAGAYIGEPPEFPRELLSGKRHSYELDASSLSITTNVPIDPLTEGVVLARHPIESFHVFSNVPLTVVTVSQTYDWGKFSNSVMLALNILNRFIPPDSDGRTSRAQNPFGTPAKKTCSSDTAVQLCDEFANEFLAHLPEHGGFISADRIKDWIRARVR